MGVNWRVKAIKSVVGQGGGVKEKGTGIVSEQYFGKCGRII